MQAARLGVHHLRVVALHVDPHDVGLWSARQFCAASMGRSRQRASVRKRIPDDIAEHNDF